jgi:hypothetical protein
MKGAAIFAGGPYYCAQGSETTAVTTCESAGPSAPSLVAITKTNFASGAIDDPSNLASQNVFLFGGADDTTVAPAVMDSLDAYYASFVGSSNINYVSRHPATAHTLPTVSYGSSCDQTSSPYVGDCGYDGAGAALAQIYGPLAPKAATLSGSFVSVPQGNFIANPASHSLADNAYAYVPSSCATGATCRIHVSFHGCEQNEGTVADAYYKHGGFNEWADTNDIIVLYPQTIDSYVSPSNPDGCWDWWGYDGANYAEKTGTQMGMVRAMVGWIAGGGLVGGSAVADGGSSTLPASDAGGTAICVTASNLAQVAAGRAIDLGGYAYAAGTYSFLGADTSSVTSSLEALGAGIYTTCP